MLSMARHSLVDARIGDRIHTRIREQASAMPGYNPAWHVVHCIGRKDHLVIDWLKKLNFETYFPHERVMKPVPMRKQSHKQRASGGLVMRPVIEPLFPRYVFVHFDSGIDGWREIFKFVGVGGMICQGNVPAPVPDALIDSIRGNEVDGAVPGKTPAKLVFSLGEEVRVTTGPLAGFIGVVDKIGTTLIEDVDESMRLTVLMSVFGRAVPTHLDVGQIEKT